MALFSKKPKTFVLGIDGVPHSFLINKFKDGEMINLRKLSEDNQVKRMNSVYPTVSSVAWTTYMTGKNPAEHNIFGFADRDTKPFRIKIPTAKDRKSKTLWKRLSESGKKVIVMNVPLTYPPEEVNGILVSCFLCTDINKSSHPPLFADYLKSKNYIIDVDAWLARKSKRKFMNELNKALDKRFEIAFELMDSKKWDFFQLHIMETDRLFHFFWDNIETYGDYTNDIKTFLNKLDNYIGELHKKLSKKDRFLILSDHGFCEIKAEFQLNKWLLEEGLLKFEEGAEKQLPNYHNESICYSLVPGRIFINLEGREEKGTVKKANYDLVREDIKKRLLKIKDPENGSKVIKNVFFREEIYEGYFIEKAPDIIAHPVNGYDLKGNLNIKSIFDHSALNGMHTYDDAFILGKNINIGSVESIQDVFHLLVD
jgi:predicted AlkP superfamily phosphohydrolase/phosphomutase